MGDSPALDAPDLELGASDRSCRSFCKLGPSYLGLLTEGRPRAGTALQPRCSARSFRSQSQLAGFPLDPPRAPTETNELLEPPDKEVLESDDEDFEYFIGRPRDGSGGSTLRQPYAGSNPQGDTDRSEPGKSRGF
jgi:hypothetical protein